MKKKLTSLVSVVLAFCMTATACSSKNSTTKKESAHNTPVGYEDGLLDVEKKDNIVVTFNTQEDATQVGQDVPSASNESTTPVKTAYESELDRFEKENLIEKQVDEMSYDTRCSLIDKMDVDSVLKDILKSVVKDLPNFDSKYKFFKLLTASEEEIPRLLENLFMDVYDGLEEIYPKDSIKIFDNRNGIIGLAKCLYMLKDPSIFGKYRLYAEEITPSSGTVGYNIIVTDEKDRILFYLKKCKRDVSYGVVQDEKLYVEPLENYLYYPKKEYSSLDLYKLKFEISRKVGSFKKIKGNRYDIDDIFVLEVPETTGSWFNSTNGKESKYYFLEKQGDYAFLEGASICRSISHDDAYVIFDTTGLYGIQYKDFEEGISFQCTENISEFDDILPLRDFMQEKGVEPFEGETCSTYNMVVLYSTLLHQEMSLEESKTITMLPTSNSNETR